MRHEYLAAMHESGSATPQTGWTPRFVTLRVPAARTTRRHGALAGVCALYLKDHSYGEYVFDHAWAHAYRQHGLRYYPKALVAPPFTPVPGARLLARDDAARVALAQGLVQWCEQSGLSSLHLLFASDADVAACREAGMMLRHNVQFHWTNTAPGLPRLRRLPGLPEPGETQEDPPGTAQGGTGRRGVSLRQRAAPSSAQDWDFFYRCYERTYYEHGNAPYLSRDFFHRMARDMAGQLAAVHRRARRPADRQQPDRACRMPARRPADRVAYGRYWGALERVDCLHFEACYYQPLQWCIAHGYRRFEGGAQGEHKMARALLPVQTTSAHWLAHPAFAEAVDDFLQRERQGIGSYMAELEQRNPFKSGSA